MFERWSSEKRPSRSSIVEERSVVAKRAISLPPRWRGQQLQRPVYVAVGVDAWSDRADPRAPRLRNPECPEYPLSSNLLALFSGSFYGTAGPDKKGKRSERAGGATKQGGRRKRDERSGESPKEREKDGGARGEGGGGVPKWRWAGRGTR